MSNYEIERDKWRNIYNKINTLCDSDIAALFEKTFLKEKYDILVANIADLITTICEGDTNIYKIFSVYYCLLWNGYFSVNNVFMFEYYDSNIQCCRGATIMCGKGVCYDIATLLSDVLNKMDVDFDACVVGVKIHKEDGWKNHHGAINRLFGELGDTSDDDTYHLNHADVLIMKDGNFYMLDPTNFLIYGLIHQNSLEKPLEENIIEARFSIDSVADYELRNRRLAQMDFVNEYLSRCTQKRLDETYLRGFLENGVILCRNHLQDIKLFFNSNYDNIQMISEQVPELAPRVKERYKKLRKKYGASK